MLVNKKLCVEVCQKGKFAVGKSGEDKKIFKDFSKNYCTF